jgi:lipid-A-disaccharide synthase-like uncharacterized protein
MNYDANFCGGGFMWIFWILSIVGVLFVLQYVIKKNHKDQMIPKLQ